jgi:predicted site-specific integrase-resolvase
MTVSAADRLVPFSDAALRLGKSPDTLRRWHDEGHLPAVVSPGGQWSTYESFITAVLASAGPRRAGVIEDIASEWFTRHGISREAVA